MQLRGEPWAGQFRQQKAGGFSGRRKRQRGPELWQDTERGSRICSNSACPKYPGPLRADRESPLPAARGGTETRADFLPALEWGDGRSPWGDVRGHWRTGTCPPSCPRPVSVSDSRDPGGCRQGQRKGALPAVLHPYHGMPPAGEISPFACVRGEHPLLLSGHRQHIRIAVQAWRQ